MKRVNVLLNPFKIMEILFTVAVALLPTWIMLYTRSWEDAFVYRMLCLFVQAFMLLIFVPSVSEYKKYPLYVLCDRTQVTAHYLSGRTLTIRKDQPVYYGQAYYSRRSSSALIYSNKVFHSTIPEYYPFLPVNITYNHSQMQLPLFFADKIFNRQRCTPVDQCSWEALTALFAPAPVRDDTPFTSPATTLILQFSDNALTAHQCGVHRCTVRLDSPVYFAVFRERARTTCLTPYVVISNERFQYYAVNAEHRSWLDKHDITKVIAFPYNNHSAAYCDFDNWICLGGFMELNRKNKQENK